MNYNRRKYEYGYRPKLFQRNHDYDYGDTYESSYLDGYTTSLISYEESTRRHHANSPRSQSEYGRPRKSSRENKYKSHIPESDNRRKHDDPIKNKSKQAKNVQNLFYQFDVDTDNKYNRSNRKSKSPKTGRYKDNHDFKNLEGGFDFEKYFDSTKQNRKPSKKYPLDDKHIQDRKDSNKEQTYSKKHGDEININSSLSEEIELTNIDYPLLAFKDNMLQDKSKASNVVYLPTVYCKDKKAQNKTNLISKTHQADMQVFTASIDGKRNIFTLENSDKKQKQKNAADKEFKQEGQLLTKKTLSNSDFQTKTSTETQTEESLVFDHRPNAQILKHATSVLGSILGRADFESKLKDITSLYKSKGAKTNNELMARENLYSYQIDVDVGKVQNKFGSTSTALKTYKINNETSQIGYKKIKTPVHDDYPVRKEYMKIRNENSIITKPTVSRGKQTPKFLYNEKNNICKFDEVKSFDLESLKCHSQPDSKESDIQGVSSQLPNYDDVLEPSLIKPTKCNTEKEKNLEVSKPPTFYIEQTNSSIMAGNVSSYPHNIQVFRSNIYDAFKKSTTSIKQPTKDHITSSPGKSSSLFSQDTRAVAHRQSGVISCRPDTKSTDPIYKVENMGLFAVKPRDDSIAKQNSHSDIKESQVKVPFGKCSIIGKQNQSVITKVISPIRDSSSAEKENHSVRKEFRADRLSRNSEMINSKTQSVVKETRAYSTKMDSSLAERKRRSVERKHGVGRPNRESSGDIQDQSLVRASKGAGLNYEKQVEGIENMGKSKGSSSSSSHINIFKPIKSKSILRKCQHFGKSITIENKTLLEAENYYTQKNVHKITENSDSEKRQASCVDAQRTDKGSSSRSATNVKASKCRFSGLYSRNKNKCLVGSEAVEVEDSNKKRSVISKTFWETDSDSVKKLRKNLYHESQEETTSKNKSKIHSVSGIRTNKHKESLSETERKSVVSLNKKLLSNKRDISTNNESDKSFKQTPSKARFSGQTIESKNKSKGWSFLKRSKAKIKRESSYSELEPSSDTTNQISSQTSIKSQNNTESSDTHIQHGTKKEKSCDCILQYIQKARQYGNFFLGTTLHEQIIGILKVI